MCRIFFLVLLVVFLASPTWAGDKGFTSAFSEGFIGAFSKGGEGWNITTANFFGGLHTNSTTFPTGIFISPDGLNL